MERLVRIKIVVKVSLTETQSLFNCGHLPRMKAEPRNNNTIILTHDFSIERCFCYLDIRLSRHRLIISLKLLHFSRASVNIGPTLRHSFLLP